MNSTSPGTRLDSIAARSPARSRAGPDGEPDGRAQLRGDDHGQAGLAQPGRAGQQDVVGRVAAPAGALQHQLELLAHARLADELGEPCAAAGVASTSRSSGSARRRRARLTARPASHSARARLAARRVGSDRGHRERPRRVRAARSSGAASAPTARRAPRPPPARRAWPEPEPQQRLDDLVARGPPAAAGAAPGCAGRRDDLVAQLEHEPLGALAADAGHPGERRDVAVGQGARRASGSARRAWRAPAAARHR